MRENLGKSFKSELNRMIYLNQGPVSIDDFNDLRARFNKKKLHDFQVRQTQSKPLVLFNLDRKVTEPKLKEMCKTFRRSTEAGRIEELRESALKQMEKLLFQAGTSEDQFMEAVREEMLTSGGIPTFNHYQHLCSVNDIEPPTYKDHYYRDISRLIVELDFTHPSRNTLSVYVNIARRIFSKASKHKHEGIAMDHERRRLMERDKEETSSESTALSTVLEILKSTQGKKLKFTIEIDAA